MMRARRRLLAAGLAWPLAGRAQERTEALWSALVSGGVAMLLRHAMTEPGVGDPPGYRVDDCTTQRNLSDAGRAQAMRIGAALRARDVRIDAVLSSRWCRCLETARLAFPQHAVEPFAALDSFFDERAAEPQRTAVAGARIAAFAGAGNLVAVTHHVNIAALTGQAVASGEAVLVDAQAGSLTVLGRLRL